MNNAVNSGSVTKRIKVSGKRQITIPISYFKKLGIGGEVDCVLTGDSIEIRPVADESEKGEFDEYILADLIKEGYSGDELLKEFKARKAKIRPAVEKMLAHGRLVAEGKIKGYTLEEVFGSEE